MIISRDQIVDTARDFIGLPWRHQGRTQHGLDCAGLLILVALKLGIRHEDKLGYGRDPSNQKFLDHIRLYTDYVHPHENLNGTIGVFRESRLPCHVGFFSSQNGVTTLIHSSAGVRKVVEEPFPHQRFKLVEARIFPEVVR